MTTHPTHTTINIRPRRRLPKIAKIAIILALTPIFAGFMVGTVIGIAHAINPPISTTDHTVIDYNDGWVGAKQDDCEQGIKLACEWLDQNHYSH